MTHTERLIREVLKLEPATRTRNPGIGPGMICTLIEYAKNAQAEQEAGKGRDLFAGPAQDKGNGLTMPQRYDLIMERLITLAVRGGDRFRQWFYVRTWGNNPDLRASKEARAEVEILAHTCDGSRAAVERAAQTILQSHS